jgi:hypothetical protein
MKKTLFVSALLLLSAVSLYAQLGSEGVFDARNYGMAKTANAVSRGVFANGINPANIIAFPSNNLEISTIIPFPSLSVKGGTNFISIDDINYFFGGVNGQARYLDANDKQRLMDLFAGGGTGGLSVTLNLFMISIIPDPSIGAFSFAVNDVAAFKCTIPSAFADIALNGNPTGKVFNFNEFDLKSWYLRSYSLSYARRIFSTTEFPFNVISAGVTVKYVQGFSYAGTDKVNSSVSTGTSGQIQGTADYRGYSAFSNNFGVKYDFDPVKPKSDFSMFPEPAGTGLGFDLGLSASFGEEWKLALSLTDLGKITWNQHAAQFTATGSIYIDDLTNEAQRDSLKDKFVGKSRKIDSFDTNLPTALRFGIARYFGKDFFLSADYNLGFNDMPGNSTKGRFSLGMEWKPMAWIPYLRSGLTFGGFYGFGWAAGLGFDINILEINIATSDFNSFAAPNKAKYLSVAIDTRWKF